MSKPPLSKDEKVYLEDTASFIKSPKEINQCLIYLTSKRIIAYKKPSFFKSIINSREQVFEIPLDNIKSIREGQFGPIDVLIFKTQSGSEYPIHFQVIEEKWVNAVVDAVVGCTPSTSVKTVGDYIKFTRQ